MRASIQLRALVVGLLAAWSAGTVAHVGQKRLVLRGAFIEACTCAGTCTFETTGKLPGCSAIGAYRIDAGSYAGASIAASRVAFVVTGSGDVFAYFDTGLDANSSAVASLARDLFSPMGTLRAVQPARITLGGREGRYRLEIGEGKSAELSIEPMRGGDGKSPVKMQNVFGDPYDVLFQARAIRGAFKKPGFAFELKGTSAFYVDRLRIDKRL